MSLNKNNLNVAIYDPQFLTREGLKKLMEDHLSVNEAHLLNTELNLEEQIQQQQPDLLVLEHKGELNIQPDILERIKKKHSKLKILILTEDDDPLIVRQFVNTGIEGFLTKQCSPQEINSAIATLKNGGKFFCHSIIDLITSPDQSHLNELSDREMQVIRYVGKGFSSEKIAEKLHVSIHTVNSHRKNVLKKLGLKSPTELIVYAVKQGWVTI